VNVTCPDCKSVFRVDPAKVPIGGVRARCSVCGGVMPVAAREFTASVEVVHATIPGGTPSTVSRAPAIPSDTSPHLEDAFGSDAEAAPEPLFPSTGERAALGGRSAGPSGSTGQSSIPAGIRASGDTQSNQGAPRPAVTAPPPRPTTPSAPIRAPFNPLLRPSIAPPVPVAHAAPGAPAVPAPPAVRPPAAAHAGAAPFKALTPPPQPTSTGSAPAPAPAPAPSPATRRVEPRPAATDPRDTQVTRAPDRTPSPAITPAAPSGVPDGRRPINPFLANDPNVKAKRLARALVSDMVAYLPQKREEGLRNNTLKALFREEIKKSYEEYVDQIGRELAESTTHFQDALNDVLSGGRKIF